MFEDVQTSINHRFKTLQIVKYPNILILSLNRISNENISIHINDELHFDDSKNMYSYKLVSIICRNGNLKSGHVFTYSNNLSTKLTKYDDEVLSGILAIKDIREEIDKKVILLFV